MIENKVAENKSFKHLKTMASNPTNTTHQLIFNIFISIIVIATLVTNSIILINVYQLNQVLAPKTMNVGDFLKRLTSHEEMKTHVGAVPLNIIQINTNNFANLQSQISGLNISYIGNFLVQYTDKVVVYDYDNDKIRGFVSFQQPQQSQLPSDFFTKLNKHSELEDLQSQQPIGGQLDQASLDTLKQQFPEIYADAKVGDFLLRYQTKLIIYDYNNDMIVNVVNLGVMS